MSATQKTSSPALYLLIIGMLVVSLVYFVLYPDVLQRASTQVWDMLNRGNGNS